MSGAIPHLLIQVLVAWTEELYLFTEIIKKSRTKQSPKISVSPGQKKK
jgi:hypothetical protein